MTIFYPKTIFHVLLTLTFLLFLPSIYPAYAFGDFPVNPLTYVFSALISPLIYGLFLFAGIWIYLPLAEAIKIIPYLCGIAVTQIILWLTHSYIILYLHSYSAISYGVFAALAPIVAFLGIVKATRLRLEWSIFAELRLIVLGSLLPGILYLFIPVLLI